MILAVRDSREAAERKASEVASLVAGERIDYVRAEIPGRPGRRHIAQVGRETREAAEELCNRLRAEGAACMVLRN